MLLKKFCRQFGILPPTLVLQFILPDILPRSFWMIMVAMESFDFGRFEGFPVIRHHRLLQLGIQLPDF